MWSPLLVLALCLCAARSASVNKDDKQELIEAKSNDYRYSVKITATKKNKVVTYCGGAQMGLGWVITAAECLDETEVDGVVLIFSAANYQYKKTSYRLESAQYAIHPEYNAKTQENNIAVIKCRFCGQQEDNNIPKVGPPQINPKKPAVLTSVMKNGEEENQDFYVQIVKTKIVSPFRCKISYFTSVRKNHICASSQGGRLLPAGTPLVIEAQEQLQIAGIATTIAPWTSWISLPMVFSRVAPYSDWIRNVTKLDMP